MGPIVIDVDPVIFQLGHFALRWYGLMIAIAVLVGFAVALREAKRRGISEDDVYGVGMWGVLGGFIGARLFHVIDRWPEYLANPSAIFAIQNGGLAIYGAIAGGLVAGAFYTRKRGISFARLADVAAPALVIGQAVGRIGCLFNGDSLGPATSLPWGVVYLNPGAMAPSLGVAYQPSPAYELIGDLLIFALLWRLRGRLRVDGSLFLVYLTLYSALKFVVTSVARTEVIFLAGMQEAQVVSAIGGIAAAALLLWLQRRENTLVHSPTIGDATLTGRPRPARDRRSARP